MKQSGREEHAAGQREVEAAKAKNVAEGVTDRAVGKKDAVVGGLTGDRSQEVAGESNPLYPRPRADSLCFALVGL